MEIDTTTDEPVRRSTPSAQVGAVSLLVSAALTFVMPALGLLAAVVTAVVWRKERGVPVVAALISLGVLGIYMLTGRFFP